MTKEASAFEYSEIIIPMHEEEMERDLIRAQKYPSGSVEREALVLSARLKEIHIQYLKLHIVELGGTTDKVREDIKNNKKLEDEVRRELEKLNIDVRIILSKFKIYN